MKFCFAGIGSIAKRHISNLREIAKEENKEIRIDALRRKGSDSGIEGIDNVYHEASDIPGGYDAIFITNPTEYHLPVLKSVIDKSENFFIEKPVTSFEEYLENGRYAPPEGKFYYVACPLRYTNVIQRLKKELEGEKIIGVRCISSSYLPEWREGVDYRETYSAHIDMGGGVATDLIHEWDYIKYLFGMPEEVVCRKAKKSSLEIDCEDTALYIAEYPEMFAELHLDYFGRKTLREIMVFTAEDTVVGDLVNSRITWLKSGRILDFGEKRNDFQMREIRHFLDMIANGEKSDSDIDDAYDTLLLTQGVIE